MVRSWCGGRQAAARHCCADLRLDDIDRLQAFDHLASKRSFARCPGGGLMPVTLQPAQNLDPHRLMTLKLDLRSHASRNTTRQTRRRSSDAYIAWSSEPPCDFKQECARRLERSAWFVVPRVGHRYFGRQPAETATIKGRAGDQWMEVVFCALS